MVLKKQKRADVAYHILANRIVISCDGDRSTIAADDEKRYKAAIAAIKADNHDKLMDLAFPRRGVQKYSMHDMDVKNGNLTHKGKKVEPYLAKIIIKLKDQGLPYEYLLKFWERLALNPEPSSINQLYKFLEHNEIPITPDGYIMAWKSVTSDMLDHHSRRVKYQLGQITKMDRSKVVCDPRQACGPGLHVGSYSFAKGFSNGILLEILVDPKDVVSVPNDSSHQKCRVCQLYVSAVCDKKRDQTKVSSPPPKAKVQNLGKVAPDDTPVPGPKPLVKKTPAKKTPAKKTAVKPTKKPVPKPPAITEVKIGNYHYTRTNIDSVAASRLRSSMTAPYHYHKLVPSELPIYFDRLEIRDVYRQRINGIFNYLAVKGTVWVKYTRIK